VLALFPADAQRTDVDGEQAQLAEVLDELRSFAMFGGVKVVVMHNADAFLKEYREKLEDYVSEPAESSKLILRFASLPKQQRIYKAIQKTGEIRTCDAPKDVVPWMIERAKKEHQITLAIPVAKQLLEQIGNDLGRLDNELAKLAIQSDDGKIDVKSISTTVAFQREQKMSAMADELASGRTEMALRRWRQLTQLDRSMEFRAVTWLTIWLEKVRRALQMKSEGMSEDAISSALNLYQFHLRAPFHKTVNALGITGTHRLIDLLATIDHQTKTGVGDATANIERFILAAGAPERGGQR